MFPFFSITEETSCSQREITLLEAGKVAGSATYKQTTSWTFNGLNKSIINSHKFLRI